MQKQCSLRTKKKHQANGDSLPFSLVRTAAIKYFNQNLIHTIRSTVVDIWNVADFIVFVSRGRYAMLCEQGKSIFFLLKMFYKNHRTLTMTRGQKFISGFSFCIFRYISRNGRLFIRFHRKFFDLFVEHYVRNERSEKYTQQSYGKISVEAIEGQINCTVPYIVFTKIERKDFNDFLLVIDPL